MNAKLVVGVVLFALVGCGSNDDAGPDGSVDLSVDLPKLVDLAPPPDLDPVITAIAITPAGKNVLVGDKVAFVATATYSDSSTKDVSASATWSSTSTAAATIAAGQLTALAAGMTSISAAQSGVTSPAVMVAVRTVTSIAVTIPSSASASIAEGADIQFTATASLSDSTTLDVTNNPATMWSSETTSIATVSGTGLGHGGDNAGQSHIYAAFAGKMGNFLLSVHP